ncbi:MAG: 4Fe-4S dicluster domain-containing protein [Desulfurococcaceae archaeon]
MDLERCSFCGECELVCSLYNDGEATPLKSRIRIIKWEGLGVSVPMVCRQCVNALCAQVCPVNAIVEDPEHGCLKVKDEVCIGCSYCAIACPFGAIRVSLERKAAIKCNLCDGNAYCTRFCPRDAIELLPVDEANVKKAVAAAHKLQDLLSKFTYPSAKG